MLDTLAPVKTGTYTHEAHHVSSQRISFDFNPEFVNKYKGERFGLFQKAFRPHIGPANDMLNIILEGFSIAPVLVGGRSEKHLKECWHLAVDFDTDDERSTLAAVANDPIVSTYGAFVYTTPSHTADTPRCRAVFILDSPITTGKGLKAAYLSLLHLFPHADQQCKNPARLYYGSKDADYVELWNQFPIADLREFAKAYKKLATLKAEEKAQKAAEFKQRAGGRPSTAGLVKMLDAIATAGAGEKYHTRTRYAYAIGGKVAAGELDNSTGEVLAAVIASARQASETPDKAEKEAIKSFDAGLANPG